MKLPRIFAFFLTTLLASFAAAESLTGIVTNGTTNKPGAGVEVTLINLAGGMEEAGSTKSDSKGRFTLQMKDSGGPHLVRATYQGATYFRMAPPGTTSVELQIYDAAKKVDGLSYTVDVLRVQTEGDQLKISRTFAVNNDSKPPKTQAGDSTFEFYVPDGAVIDSSMAKAPNGQPVVASIDKKDKGRYAFSFPLRPGETQLNVAYHLPYSGSMTVDPKAPYPLQHLVVLVPKSMTFEEQNGAQFQTMQNGPMAGAATVEVAQQTQPGQSVSFKISGTGTLPAETEQSTTGGGGGGGEGGGGGRSGPGGGLGTPTGAPDPLQSFKWYILGFFVLVLGGGGWYITTRKPQAAGAGAAPAKAAAVSAPARAASPTRTAPASAPAAGATAASNGNLLLQAMKEELFQLEIEKQQGKISAQEYEKTKAALDQTLKRALQRAGN